MVLYIYSREDSIIELVERELFDPDQNSIKFEVARESVIVS